MRFRFAITPIRFIFRIQNLDEISWDNVIFWIRFVSVMWVVSWIRYRTTYHEQDMTSGIDRSHIVISRNEWTKNITFRIFFAQIIMCLAYFWSSPLCGRQKYFSNKSVEATAYIQSLVSNFAMSIALFLIDRPTYCQTNLVLSRRSNTNYE